MSLTNPNDIPTKGFVDVTDTIEVYPGGKTWDCPCGAGIGTKHADQAVKCYSCGYILEDNRASQREKQAENKDFSDLGQTTLFDDYETQAPNDDTQKVQDGDEPSEDTEPSKKERQTELFEHETEEDQSSLGEYL